MQTEAILESVDIHTAGEPTRIITGGFQWQNHYGTAFEYQQRFKEKFDWIRTLLMKEPRGHDDMFGAVPVPSSTGDIGVFFMDNSEYKDMCGHGTIGLVTALVETGQLPTNEELKIETPAGLVTARPNMEDGRVESVAVENVDSYVYDSITIEFDPVGTVNVDIIYAGNFFVLVDATDLELEVNTDNTAKLVEYGMRIKQRVNTEMSIMNPVTGEPDKIKLAEIYHQNRGTDQNITIFGNGQVDRSPCGTGTCAKMALLHSEDKLDAGDTYPYQSIIGTEFTGRILDTTSQGSKRIISPEIEGSAYLISKNTYFVDPSDPLDGFTLGVVG